MVHSFEFHPAVFGLSKLLVYILQVFGRLHAPLLDLAQLVFELPVLVLLILKVQLTLPDLLFKLLDIIKFLIDERPLVVAVGPGNIDQVFILLELDVECDHLLLQLLYSQFELAAFSLGPLLLLSNYLNLRLCVSELLIVVGKLVLDLLELPLSSL